MNKYPTVNYIGNKEKIASWIIDNFPIKKGTVLDLFCGGCSVSYELKKRGFKVISNDALYSNYVLAKAIIENSKEKLQICDFETIKVEKRSIEKQYKKISFLKNLLYFDYEVKELSKLIVLSDKISNYKYFIFLALLRRAMIRKIPYSRMNIKWEEIKKFRDENYSYAKYGRYRHYHNIPFVEHIKQAMEEYNNSIFNNSNIKCLATRYDAIECVDNLNKKIDLIYIDPPYPGTMNKYYDFYGFYDIIFERHNIIKTDLTDKSNFLTNFSKLIQHASKKSRYIAISLNNKCYPNVNILLDVIKPYISSHEILKKEHIYKVTGKLNKHSNYEILLICKTKGGVKHAKKKSDKESTI